MNEIYKDIQGILAVSDIHPADCIKINNLIVELIEENQELKLELSGYRQAILEDKDMLGLKEESEELKKQLHDASIKIQELIEKDIWCPSNCEKLETQQKEFTNYLEDKINYYKRNTQCFSMNLIEEILQKYKSIIGVSDDKTN